MHALSPAEHEELRRFSVVGWTRAAIDLFPEIEGVLLAGSRAFGHERPDPTSTWWSRWATISTRTGCRARSSSSASPTTRCSRHRPPTSLIFGSCAQARESPGGSTDRARRCPNRVSAFATAGHSATTSTWPRACPTVSCSIGSGGMSTPPRRATARAPIGRTAGVSAAPASSPGNEHRVGEGNQIARTHGAYSAVALSEQAAEIEPDFAATSRPRSMGSCSAPSSSRSPGAAWLRRDGEGRRRLKQARLAHVALSKESRSWVATLMNVLDKVAATPQARAEVAARLARAGVSLYLTPDEQREKTDLEQRADGDLYRLPMPERSVSTTCDERRPAVRDERPFYTMNDSGRRSGSARHLRCCVHRGARVRDRPVPPNHRRQGGGT